MRIILLLILTSLTISSIFSQTLKKYTGYLEDSRPNGKLTYSYYEDPTSNVYIKEGPFNYSYSGQDGNEGLKLSITGSYSKGLKTGTWNYTAQMTDYSVGSEYQTGTVTFVANYKNGYADGNWKQVRSYKTRNKGYRRGQYYWEPFGPVKTMTINLNFKNGNLVGLASINDDFANFKASGSFDQNSLAIGKWIINDRAWGQNKDLTYKEGVLSETIFRENSGAVSGTSNYHDDYESYLTTKNNSLTELEDSGIIIDTICGEKCAATSYLLEYFKKMSSYKYFPLGSIGGDFTMSEGLKGGCELKIKRRSFADLKTNNNFLAGETHYSKGDLLNALREFGKIDLNSLKSSQRESLKTKLNDLIIQVEPLIEKNKAEGNFVFNDIKSQQDSINIIYKSIVKNFTVKSVKEFNPTTHQLELKKPLPLSSSCDCNTPWNEQNLQTGIDCIYKNPLLFYSYQKAFLEGYFGYLNFLKNAEIAMKNSSNDIKYKNINHKFYEYKIDEYKALKDEVRERFQLAKKTANSGQKINELSSEISNLNGQTKKKTLFNKYLFLESDFNKKSMDYANFNDLLNQQFEFKLFQEKIILLYSKDTKQLEKQLKKSESIDQIKKLIMDAI